MKKTIFLLSASAILFSFSIPIAIGTDGLYPFSKWDEATIAKANTAKNEAGYSPEEKKVVLYVNLARLNPDLFAKTYFQHYLDSTKTSPTSFTRSAYNDLTTKYKPMDALFVKSDLTEEASNHAKDSGKSGKIGHTTSDGKSYEFRMKNMKGTYMAFGENCGYGYNDALSIVIDMLIDEGQATIEHRKNIMEKKYKFVGASIQPHKKEKWTCVIEFAGETK